MRNKALIGIRKREALIRAEIEAQLGVKRAEIRDRLSSLTEQMDNFKEMAEKVEAGQDVWDLYDPGPMLEHKVQEKSREITGGGSEDTAFD